MTSFKTLTTLATTLMLGLGINCAAKPQNPNSTAPSTSSAFTSHNTYLKPGASVSYSHNLKPALTAGETLTFQLTLHEGYESGQLNVDIAPEGAVSLFGPADQARINMSEGSDHVVDVTVTANANGRHYINVHAVTDSGMPRIFGIAVQVGPHIAAKPSPLMKTMPNGQNLIIMDAQEEIK